MISDWTWLLAKGLLRTCNIINSLHLNLDLHCRDVMYRDTSSKVLSTDQNCLKDYPSPINCSYYRLPAHV